MWHRAQLYFYYFYMCEYFAYMHVCALLKEARREHQIPLETGITKGCDPGWPTRQPGKAMKVPNF